MEILNVLKIYTKRDRNIQKIIISVKYFLSKIHYLFVIICVRVHVYIHVHDIIIISSKNNLNYL